MGATDTVTTLANTDNTATTDTTTMLIEQTRERLRSLKLTGMLDADLRRFVDTDDTVCSINYPVNRYPEKVKSVGFDKHAEIEGCLAGIKGQYLIFDDNRVLNIRKHNGYRITMT